MSANNLFAIEVHINQARVSVDMRRMCAQLDPECAIPSCVPRARPHWTVETQTDGTRCLVQHWAVMPNSAG